MQSIFCFAALSLSAGVSPLSSSALRNKKYPCKSYPPFYLEIVLYILEDGRLAILRKERKCKMEANQSIDRLRDDIVRICNPETIMLFSKKQNVHGDLCAVKLCVIIAEGDAHQVERRLYVDIPSDIPFDVLVYTREDWERHIRSDMSFAAHIAQTGRVLYARD